MIYSEYLSIGAEDGYIYDIESGKLRTCTNQPVDLNLMYTCRRVANEMRGLALRMHTITFRPLYTDELRNRAFCCEYLVSFFAPRHSLVSYPCHCNLQLLLTARHRGLHLVEYQWLVA